MMTDLSDRTKIRQKLLVCIDPTIALVTPEAQTNVYDCLQISNAQYADFEASLPQGFHDPIPKKVTLAGKTNQIS